MARRTRTGRLRAALLALLLLAVPATPVAALAPTGPHVGADIPREGWVRPVPGDVVHPFDPPPQDWLPGHRGVDLTATRGDPVAAPAAGVVTFAGSVGGKPLVVVAHHDGLRSTLEPVEAAVARGTPVPAGAVVGTLSIPPGTADNPSHCAPEDCLHWGVRRGDRYLDPMVLLGLADPVVLLPLS
jgi:murein DD-endopeptidase MepM/ murein hydrolase activator NlpD